ncbi:hypothetical protein K488DRAFT_74846 [Vararia minispora EC-137]|uniref:Uncharacterized protein n=1 Tax=Vararia minispora EC-137 TaxID=1314806 RepID=A0ACB8Q5W3_9AGAM|nr:hypothetical protein K488DRAFT_74846 [Vararia minispora EC-137]
MVRRHTNKISTTNVPSSESALITRKATSSRVHKQAAPAKTPRKPANRHDPLSLEERHILLRIFRADKRPSKPEMVIIAARMSAKHRSYAKIESWFDNERRFYKPLVQRRMEFLAVPDETVKARLESAEFAPILSKVEEVLAQIPKKTNETELKRRLNELVAEVPGVKEDAEAARRAAAVGTAVADPDLDNLEAWMEEYYDKKEHAVWMRGDTGPAKNAGTADNMNVDGEVDELAGDNEDREPKVEVGMDVEDVHASAETEHQSSGASKDPSPNWSQREVSSSPATTISDVGRPESSADIQDLEAWVVGFLASGLSCSFKSAPGS